ncbi:hypothetical protein SAMN02799642_05172 [Methylobacterium brachiatum]|nr:hypothetical protein SAMN02799642_05172 [Methylobacterium brachiatum]
MRRRRAAAPTDGLPDDPALIAAQIQRHLKEAQAAIGSLIDDLAPRQPRRPVSLTPDLFAHPTPETSSAGA